MHDAREQADPELCCWSADEIEGARQRSVDHGMQWVVHSLFLPSTPSSGTNCRFRRPLATLTPWLGILRCMLT
jgi:hypothetical protein